MERGIYFDAWYKNEYCFHPRLPMHSGKRVQYPQFLRDDGKRYVRKDCKNRSKDRQDKVKCEQIGAAAIIVSHHHGRQLCFIMSSTGFERPADIDPSVLRMTSFGAGYNAHIG